MSTREYFVRAIASAPDDDLPRLVFADWLEENGDPEWAAYIRAACTYARRTGWDEEAERLHSAFSETYDVADRLRAELGQLKGVQWFGHLERERGMVERATVTSPRTFAAEADRIYSLTCIRFLTLQNPNENGLAVVLAVPHLVLVRELTIVGPTVSDEAVGMLVDSPHLTGLRELRLEGGKRHRLTGKAVRRLAESELVGRLTLLDLSDNRDFAPSKPLTSALTKACGEQCELRLPTTKKKKG